MTENASPPAGTGCPAELTNVCARRHWSLFWLFIAAAVAMAASRVLTVGMYSDDGSPFFSANDRSRWCTIRALGDEGTYEIDQVLANQGEINWNTIDRVRHSGVDGKIHDYSSKPTLLPTLLAGGYKAVKLMTGWTLAEQPLWVARLILFLANVIPFAIYLWMFAHIVNAIPVRDWTRYFMMIVAGFATFLSTFIVTLNNHLPAAFSVMIVLFCLLKILQNKGNLWHFLVTGLFSAFAAANELPALSFCLLAGAICLYRSPAKTMVAWLPAVAVVAGGFFYTNYLAHHDWKPAYAHRGDGELIAAVVGDFSGSLDSGVLPEQIANSMNQKFDLSIVEKGTWPGTSRGIRRWIVSDFSGANRVAIVSEVDSSEFRILEWQNWYDYPGSYWRLENENKSSVDRGQTSSMLYLFHILFGHHGIFSLTPIWFLALPGLIVLVFSNRLGLRWLGWLGLVLSVVVVAFYVSRSPIDRNYGGWTSGLRWLFWLTPIWLMGMLPIVDWLGKTNAGRWTCFVLLALSILSVNYSAQNPWVQPWLYEVWDVTGLPK